MIPWEPKRREVLWAREVLARIADGDIVIFPVTESLALQYVVHHQRKTMTLDNVEELLDREMLKAHIRGTIIFATAGYKVEHDILTYVALRIQAHRMDCEMTGMPVEPGESELLTQFFQSIAEQIERNRRESDIN
jgi:hypothetical protein